MNGVLDTSVVIAIEQDRQLEVGKLLDTAGVSIATLAELELGVLMARSEAERERRKASLDEARSLYVALPATEAVASAYAAVVATMRRAGRAVRVQDAWIAATARVHGVPVFTQDADFDHLPVDVVRV